MCNIEQLERAYAEYNSILAQYSGCEIIEDKNKVIIKINEIVSVEVLEKINDFVGVFQAYINPFSENIDEIISNIQVGINGLDDIDNVSLIYNKPTFQNIDEIYFQYNKTIFESEDIDESDIKLDIVILNLESGIETVTTRLLTLNDLKEGIDSKKSIDKNTREIISFYVSSNKKESMSFFKNAFAYKIEGNLGKDKFEVRDIILLDLKRMFYVDLLKCLSDKNDSNGFLIRGEKSLQLKLNESFKVNAIESLEEWLDFLVNEKTYTQKFLISKKVLSLYLSDNDNIDIFDVKLPKIWKTVKHYYDNFTEENVKDFFKIKDQLLKEAMNVSKVVYEQTDKINTTIFASLFSVLVLFCTTVIRSFSNLTDIYIYSMVILLLVFSIIFYRLIYYSSTERYKLSKAQFDYFLNEVAIILPEDIEQIRTTYLTQPYSVLENTLKKLLVFLIVINLISFAFLLKFSSFYFG